MFVDISHWSVIVQFIRKTMTTPSILLTAILLAAMLSNEPVATEEVGAAGQQAKRVGGGNSGPSSVDLYNNMILGEQELENNGGNVNDDDDDDDGDDDDDDGDTNRDGLLHALAPIRYVSDDHVAAASNDQHKHHLKCLECRGVLPTWSDEPEASFDEQSYCFPDGNNGRNECSKAMRCWKAKVRENNGRVQISRGCVGGADFGKRSDQDLLHPCMGAVPVVSSINETATRSSDNNSAQRSSYTVWTSSHTYSSTDAEGEQSPLPPPSYAIECCAGRDLCNDGPFPSLPLLPGSSSSGLDGDGSSLLAAVARWRWSSIVMVSLLAVVIVVSAVTAVVVVVFRNDGKKKRRKHRKKNGRRTAGKRGKSRHYREDGHSDDSDKKGGNNRRSSVSSGSVSSSLSLSSVVSSSSCCKGKSGKSRRKRAGTTLTMVDLLMGVRPVDDGDDDDDTTYDGGSGHRPPYATDYSPAALTESTLDDDFLPPPYQKRNGRHQKDNEQDDWTSGSGYGMPVLVQRTLAKQIQLRQLVGKGRYGEVWRATYWNGGHEHVAVKIFLSKDEPSWKRETEIYSTVLMRHDNILGFIGSDIMTSRNSYTTQLLLITHYHQYGSLYDFLQTPGAAADSTCIGYDVGATDAAGGRPQQTDRPPLTMSQMLNVLYTVASGLCHLHTEIHGTQGKPGIAHRDVKSKNVLVKCARTGACCVADFGMAVTSRDATLPVQTTSAIGSSQNTRVGTKRYMAPEVLDDSITSAAALALASGSTAASSESSAYWCFDAYRRGDVYSYALVMWEVLSRTIIPTENGVSPPRQRQNDEQPPQPLSNSYDPFVYRAPYQDRGVGWDPGFDDMRRVVCSPDPVMSRPGIATEWLANLIMNTVVVTMRECWHGNPNARLPALRVKKTLAKLIIQCAASETEQQQQQLELEPNRGATPTTTTEQL